MLAAERARRGAIARLRRSRVLRWRYRSPAVEDFLIAPPDLRTQDLSFADEIAAGNFGLAGCVARLSGHSPFAHRPANPEWAHELHGFGWLRHLEGIRSVEIEGIARNLVRDWIRRGRANHPQAWELGVVARRIISWLAHSRLLLDGAERKTFVTITGSLADQITFLAASWRNAPDGYRRLVSLIALTLADLCIAGHDRRLDESEKLLAAELARQILPDGCHLSRNPAVLVELLFDLLPLRQCFAARGRKLDPSVLAAISRMGPMLRHLRLGDGMLARFNGMGVTERDALATVLAYDGGQTMLPGRVLASGYVRLERGSTVVVFDAGPPPALELAQAACAGCLSFELSAGTDALLVNSGAPRQADVNRRSLSRATANHNTLCLNEQSSSKLMRGARLERQLGGAPIRHPDHVACEVREVNGGIELRASHDGYADRFGLVHARTLKLNREGSRLEGVDTLAGAAGVMRFSWDLPFTIHLHAHPDAQVRPGRLSGTAELLLRSGEVWQLSTAGAALSIEPSTHFADLAAPRQAQQVVLRASCCGDAEVSWILERVSAGRPDRPSRPARN
jgi:uncharacterized heparinase superfamily protein